MADDRIAIQHVDLVLAQASQGGPLIVRKIDCAGNVALGVILGGAHVYDICLVGLHHPFQLHRTSCKSHLGFKKFFRLCWIVSD